MIQSGPTDLKTFEDGSGIGIPFIYAALMTAGCAELEMSPTPLHCCCMRFEFFSDIHVRAKSDAHFFPLANNSLHYRFNLPIFSKTSGDYII